MKRILLFVFINLKTLNAKKWLMLFILSLTFATSIQAQKIRFTDTSNKWGLFHRNNDGPTVYYWSISQFYSTDTVLSGITYRHFTSTRGQSGQKPEFAFREDTLSGKIFVRFLSGQSNPYTDTLEHLFFDYGLVVGDTLKSNYPNQNWIHIVTAIDTIKLAGIPHRRWFMNVLMTGSGLLAAPFQFIEGLGTANGPAFPIFPVNFENIDALRCFMNQNQNPPCSPALQTFVDSFNNITSCKPSGVLTNKPENTITITPNPGNSEISLNLPSEIHFASIRITDCTGRIIRLIITTSSKTNIGQCLSNSGLYYYLVQDLLTGQRYSGKFIFKP